MKYSNLKSSQTFKNLARAFAGESQARIRYQFLEYAATQQKLIALSKVIKDIERNEFNHARMFYTFIQKASPDKPIDSIEICAGYPFKDKWNFVENFTFNIENELEESDSVYPEYAKIAESEGYPEIAKLFLDVASVEKCHHLLLKDIHDQLVNNTMYKKTSPVKWKCSQCGHEHYGLEAPLVCPLCNSPVGNYMLILKDNN